MKKQYGLIGLIIALLFLAACSAEVKFSTGSSTEDESSAETYYNGFGFKSEIPGTWTRSLIGSNTVALPDESKTKQFLMAIRVKIADGTYLKSSKNIDNAKEAVRVINQELANDVSIEVITTGERTLQREDAIAYEELISYERDGKVWNQRTLGIIVDEALFQVFGRAPADEFDTMDAGITMVAETVQRFDGT
jgi:major membrane immunogen (membrane-anchored lipoprotein)